MEINYDREADSIYTEFRKGEFAKSSKISKKFLGHKKSQSYLAVAK